MELCQFCNPILCNCDLGAVRYEFLFQKCFRNQIFFRLHFISLEVKNEDCFSSSHSKDLLHSCCFVGAMICSTIDHSSALLAFDATVIGSFCRVLTSFASSIPSNGNCTEASLEARRSGRPRIFVAILVERRPKPRIPRVGRDLPIPWRP